MLLCAEKRGRFIPCRGGGTATTYYTDWHIVDEDVVSISMHGGRWTDGIQTGIALRNIRDTSVDPNVASRLIYLS